MPQIIQQFTPQGGKHCITASLKQIFAYYGHPLSEEMLFGLGEGLDFTYINLAAAPMVSGRAGISGFEETLSERLGIAIRVRQSKDSRRAADQAKRMIDSGHPVLVYTDMPYLDYLSMPADSHFGGHSIVIFGYDDEQAVFYVSDRDHSDHPIRTPHGPVGEDYHLLSYDRMEMARSSRHRPFPANNKYLKIDFAGYQGITADMLRSSIQATCKKMLHPGANLKGISGIAKFAKEIRKWQRFEPDQQKRAGATNYFQIHADGGTGGGIFRRMFGGYLLEASAVMKDPQAAQIGHGFIDLSMKWDLIAESMWQLHQTGSTALLDEMSGYIAENCRIETELLESLDKIV